MSNNEMMLSDQSDVSRSSPMEHHNYHNHQHQPRQQQMHNQTNIWNNFLVNLLPKCRRNFSNTIVQLSKQQQERSSSYEDNELKQTNHNVHFAVPSGDGNEQGRETNIAIEDDLNHSDWYQFDKNDLIKPKTPLVMNIRSEEQEQYMVHCLSTGKMAPDGHIRKSWGNFINIFDGQGKQKICIGRSELSNYLTLTIIGTEPKTTFQFIVTLFTGNYPKPLFRSNWSWRMRWNMFVAGIDQDILETIETTYNDGIDFEMKDNPSSTGVYNKGDLKLLHLGEIHIYFHIERDNHCPIYQNLCFFFDPVLLNYCQKLTHGNRIKTILDQVALTLRYQLSLPKFVSQLYFPVKKMRFEAQDQTVDYFELRQKDLQAAILIANQSVPFSLLNSSFSNSSSLLNNHVGKGRRTQLLNTRSHKHWPSSSPSSNFTSLSQHSFLYTSQASNNSWRNNRQQNE